MTKMENICYSIYKGAVGYNTSGYKENKTIYISCLNGYLKCLVETRIVDGFDIQRDFYRKITEVCLWINKGDTNTDVIIDVENHVAMSSLWEVDLELMPGIDCRTGIRNLGRKVTI